LASTEETISNITKANNIRKKPTLKNKWSKQFDERPHRLHTRTVQSHSPFYPVVKMAPIHPVGFLKFHIFTVGRVYTVKMHHHAEFGEDRFDRC